MAEENEKTLISPCPFCGAAAHTWLAFPQSETPWYVFVDHDERCILRTAMDGVMCCATEGEMADAWNRRFIPHGEATPFAYTTQVSVDLLKGRPAHKGSFALFLPFDGMDEIKGVEFVPLYSAPQPLAAVTEAMVERVWAEAQHWPTPITVPTIRRVLTAGLKVGS